MPLTSGFSSSKKTHRPFSGHARWIRIFRFHPCAFSSIRQVPMKQGCHYHPSQPAYWNCPRCNQNLCVSCISVRDAGFYGGNQKLYFCPKCNLEMKKKLYDMTYYCSNCDYTFLVGLMRSTCWGDWEEKVVAGKKYYTKKCGTVMAIPMVGKVEKDKTTISPDKHLPSARGWGV